MAKRATVYLVERTLEVAGEGESLSGRLNQIVARYDDLVRVSLPDLKDNEWCAVFEANNGYLMVADSPPTQGGIAAVFTGVWANVADSQGFEGKWDVDVMALAEKLRNLDPAQKVAVIEAIQTFWEHTELPTEEALARAIRRRPA